MAYICSMAATASGGGLAGLGLMKVRRIKLRERDDYWLKRDVATCKCMLIPLITVLSRLTWWSKRARHFSSSQKRDFVSSNRSVVKIEINQKDHDLSNTMRSGLF